MFDGWIGKKIGMPLTRENLESWQLEHLKSTVELAVSHSPWYKQHLQGADFDDFEEFSDLPFMLPEDVKEAGEEMVCVPARDISRIVTLNTSGTTGRPKRVFFTEEDQELTVDFFHYGMMNMIDETDRLLILMQGERPGSVGDLLKRGVERMGAEALCLGEITERLSFNTIFDTIYDRGITSIVGIPEQMRALMKYSTVMNIRTVLLSAEYVPQSLVADLHRAWHTEVFEHYGMTEMGLGCAMSCSAHRGYHVREADLYIEIIDPDNGYLQEDGKWGEIVFTTLTRKGMPFIRYRTGDEGRWLTEKCPCGSIIKRLDKVKNRKIYNTEDI
jgi:phenylacetate-CoA ligase